MSVDLSQFYEVFFEESFEGLDVMESELLNLQPGTPDDETINTIFRSAHSIKGGSGTFGFTSVADFTHVAETLLDQIRDGQRQLTQHQIDLFLQSVDCLRAMLESLRTSEEPDITDSSALKKEFELILANNESAANTSAVATELSGEAAPSSVRGSAMSSWNVDFKPGLDILKTGNEPIYMLLELADLADKSTFQITANTAAVPLLSEIDAESCYLHWQINFQSECEQPQIEEVFDWVADESDISIAKQEEGNKEEQSSSITPLENNESARLAPSAEKIEKADAPVKTNVTNSTKSTEATSIRVSTDKVDSLINMVGELVITQAMLTQLTEGEFDITKLASIQEGMAQLAHNTRDLQESVMRIRMLPISFVFSRFPRLVRDTSKKLGKEIELKLLGEQTELDKTVMEKISDPMVHLVRNSMDHGLESPEERVANGKDKVGNLTLNAYHQGGNVVVEISDDGKGLNTSKIKSKALENGLIQESDNLSEQEINELIFEPGFSTADVVSDLSGRGVGMDVVRRNIQSLNGSIELASTVGEGSKFTIRLPLTLAILDGQLVRVGKHIYIIPLVNIIESLQVDIQKVNHVGGEYEVLRLRDEYVPILRLYDAFNHKSESEKLEDGLLVVVENDNGKVGILVDELLSQQQVVIKSLEANYAKVEGVSGATILGDGTVSLIIDVAGLVRLAGLNKTVKANLHHSLDASEVA